MCAQFLGWTSLHHAAINGDVEIVRMLLDGGADMEIKDKVSDVHLFIITIPWLTLSFDYRMG